MDRYRITDGMGVYFITFTIVDWLPVFVDEIPITALIDSLKYCIAHKNLRVNAYVIMPNHFHAVVFDAAFDPLNLKRALTDFRKFSGRQLSDYVDARYSKEVAAVLKNDELKDRERRFWQSGWHAEGIYSEHFLEQKVNYLHWNPCRKGLVRSPQDWRYSSAAYWLDGKQVDLPLSKSNGRAETCGQVARVVDHRAPCGRETGAIRELITSYKEGKNVIRRCIELCY